MGWPTGALGVSVMPEGLINPPVAGLGAGLIGAGTTAPAGAMFPTARAAGTAAAVARTGTEAVDSLSTGALGEPGIVSTGMGLLTISDEIGAGLTNDLGWGAERPAVDIGAGNPEGGEPRLMAGGVAAGVIAGLFGVGGGVVFVPTLVLLFGFGQLDAQATSLEIGRAHV
mgnify:CR=1 FL=1